MSEARLCCPPCEHLRSFRYGFGGGMIIAPTFDTRDAMGACLLRKDGKLFAVGVSACWRGREE